MATKDLKFLLPDLEKFTERKIVQLGLECTANFTESTPRDTGWAAANWVPNIGVPYQGGGPRPTDPPVGQAESNKAAGISKVLGYKLKTAQSIFVTNNVPYIVELNEGSSRKAPAAFIQRDIDTAINTVSSTP